MSSAGHVLDMIIRMRQNRAIRTSNKQKFRSNNREAAHRDNGAEALHYKVVPKERLKNIKAKIRLKARFEQRKEIIVIFIFFMLVIFIVYTYMI
ncbi:hypothetical protein DWB61_02855 [Ancylomarina euxinus]|uniref:Uncharacterized protein n=1 Tax=Ancylomarina euxinus TaxID=2283627 RepID=A0A425Y6D2_9BACT|nr:hypothetical protein [Ancylomarina euxinus]MCZ4694057.1 hypothetical protein [Ancylomarina euxinus]MUP14523.1 hypothetical protein [Ancylomarina euxinus]RRG24073.1 hypothetical protein DWB61_02855 [Ancylomarina euxinus]